MGRSKRKRNGDRTTRALANMALQLKEQAFKRRFAEVDDDKLLNYLAHCAGEFVNGPACTDVLGAAVLKERFGDWDSLLLKIGSVKMCLACLPEKLLPRRKYTKKLWRQCSKMRKILHFNMLVIATRNCLNM